MRGRAFRRSLAVAFLAGGLLTSPAWAQEKKSVYSLQVDGLACPFCAYGIEKKLNAVEGVESVETDIKSGTVTVTMQDGAALEEDTARTAVEAAGFTLRGFGKGAAGE